MTSVGPSGLPVLMDTFARLAKSPVVSIAKESGSTVGEPQDVPMDDSDGQRGNSDNRSMGVVASRPSVGELVKEADGACCRGNP